MQVICSNCNSKYRIADNKLKGRDRIRLKCKKCDNIIEAKVNNIADEDTSNLFSMSSNKSIADAVNTNSKKEDDIFEDSLFANAKEGFSFEDDKKTLILDTSGSGFGKQPSENTKQPKFKSNFQMDLSEPTSEHTNEQSSMNTSHNSAAVSFETTQQISVEKFNEYQKNKELSTSTASPMLATSTQKLVKNNVKKGIDSKTRDKFDDISKEFKDKSPRKSGGGIFKFIFIIFFVISLLFVFVLFKNNWNLDLNNIPKMVENSFGLKTEKLNNFNKDVNKAKPLKEQFFIDGKKIKANIFKLSRRKRDKRYALTISGEVKNIDSVKKSLTTVSIEVENILNNEIILEKRIYAGNFFTKKEIIKAKNDETLSAEYLQSGKNGANWGVLPNKTIPFMAVFYLKKKINLTKVKIKVKIKSTQ